MSLKWHGDEVKKEFVEGLKSGLLEFGFNHEREAKAQLYFGHGKASGTLQRSIHAASPHYDFAQDDEPPSENSPERSGTGGGAELVGDKVIIKVGSGMIYAARIERLYNYIRNGHERAKNTLMPALEKHLKARGF